jgi:O-antigen/teichoic acid export membrane protein
MSDDKTMSGKADVTMEITVTNSRKAFRASIFVIFGFGLSQMIRLGGNLILTRLLVPEYFGIIALVQVFITGVGLFSDIGLEPGVIRSSRYKDPVFLNTAWTVQVIRGPVLWLFSLIVAYPVSVFYGEPILFRLIPFVGSFFIIEGFKSTSLYILNKKLHQGKLTLIELVSQTAGLILIISIAYVTRSVWALAIGGVTTQAIKTVWSHFLYKDFKHRFSIEKESLKELITFGKWIFFSTAMMFLASQSDRLILGKLFTLSFFGIYNIAVIFAEVSKQVVNRLSSNVIFPFLSHFKDLPRCDFKREVRRHRRIFLYPLAVFIGLLTGFGDVLIQFLYDPRYEHAAWVLPLLALGMWPLVLTATIDRTLLILGKPHYLAFANLSKFIYMIIIVPLSYAVWGTIGAVIAVALNDLPLYIITAVGLIRERLTLYRQDLAATLILLAAVMLCIVLRTYMGLGLPGVEVFQRLNLNG